MPENDAAAVDTSEYVYVSYQAYLTASAQRGIRADYLIPEAEFTDSLANLCDNTVDEFSYLDRSHRSAASASDVDPGMAYRWMTAETTVRVELGCPDRMSDWVAGTQDQTT